MPALTRLDVVNDMLACLAELPVNSLEEGHPLVPTAIRVLAAANTRELSKSWWFNKELVDLVPDTDGNIFVPGDTLKIDPQRGSLHYVQRGRRLYKPFEPNAATKYTFTEKVRVWLVREVPFEDCPVTAQLFVSYSAQLDFMKSYEADPQKFKQVTDLYRDTLITLNSEHTRAMNANGLARRPIFNERTEIGSTSMEADYWPHP